MQPCDFTSNNNIIPPRADIKNLIGREDVGLEYALVEMDSAHVWKERHGPMLPDVKYQKLLCFLWSAVSGFI